MYCAPISRKILAIHLLSTFSYNTKTKYLTSGTQQRFVPDPGSCIAYQADIAFSLYLEDSGRISIIAEKVEAIETLIPKNFISPSQRIKSILFTCPIQH